MEAVRWLPEGHLYKNAKVAHKLKIYLILNWEHSYCVRVQGINLWNMWPVSRRVLFLNVIICQDCSIINPQPNLCFPLHFHHWEPLQSAYFSEQTSPFWNFSQMANSLAAYFGALALLRVYLNLEQSALYSLHCTRSSGGTVIQYGSLLLYNSLYCYGGQP